MSYGYDGGYGGGGYMNDSQSGTQATPGRSVAKNTLRPVTIKQILEAQTPHDDNTFVIDDVEIGNVTFVAQIRSMADQETNSTYKMEDGTGTIEVKQFRDNRNSMVDDGDGEGGLNRDSSLQINSYARVVGNIKQFNNKRNITTQSVRPVTDFNEIQCHFLEVTAVHLHFTRGSPESQQAKNPAGGGTAYHQGAAGSYGEDTPMGNTVGGASAGTMLPPGMSANARRVYTFLKGRHDSSEGMHVGMIGQSIGMPTGETYKAVDELLTNGVCFTTMDDEHVACMDF